MLTPRFSDVLKNGYDLKLKCAARSRHYVSCVCLCHRADLYVYACGLGVGLSASVAMTESS